MRNNRPRPYTIDDASERVRLAREMSGYLRISRYWGMVIDDAIFDAVRNVVGIKSGMTPYLATKLLPYVNHTRFITDGTDADGRQFARYAIEQMAKLNTAVL